MTIERPGQPGGPAAGGGVQGRRAGGNGAWVDGTLLLAMLLALALTLGA